MDGRSLYSGDLGAETLAAGRRMLADVHSHVQIEALTQVSSKIAVAFHGPVDTENLDPKVLWLAEAADRGSRDLVAGDCRTTDIGAPDPVYTDRKVVAAGPRDT